MSCSARTCTAQMLTCSRTNRLCCPCSQAPLPAIVLPAQPPPHPPLRRSFSRSRSRVAARRSASQMGVHASVQRGEVRGRPPPVQRGGCVMWAHAVLYFVVSVLLCHFCDACDPPRAPHEESRCAVSRCADTFEQGAGCGVVRHSDLCVRPSCRVCR